MKSQRNVNTDPIERGWRPLSRRRGYTTVEMLIVLTVFTFVLGTVSLALSTLWRTQSDMQLEGEHAATVTRLARQLREDAHLARSATIQAANDNAGESLRFEGASGQVSYAILPRRIIRTLLDNEQLLHREVFELGDFVRANWRIDESTQTLRVLFAYHDPKLGESSPPTRHEEFRTRIDLLSGGVK